jgi:cytochrome P450
MSVQAVTPPRAPSAPPPEPLDRSIRAEVRRGLREEVAARRRTPLPAGSLRLSLRNTLLTTMDPLRLVLEHYRRYGPVFTIRLGFEATVWAISPQATHQMLVTDADAFSWREGRFSDLWPLLGDSFFAIDGEYHRQTRRMLLPAFHADAVEGVAERMVVEAVKGVEALRPGERVDIYVWIRELAMRVAQRALAGIEDSDEGTAEFARAFERALSFHGRPIPLQMLRGPRTPFADMLRARARLDGMLDAHIERRAGGGTTGPGVLGMLLAARDEHGEPLPRAAVRDHLMTLLFAGHDTTTATFTFLAYELGRNPEAREALAAELDDVLGDADPTPEQLDGRALPVLERTLNETLRRYPAAWVGPRKTTRDVVLDGVPVPPGVPVNYSSWATHHIDELYPDPLAFRPDRFLPGGEVDALPKGAYVPFGGGTRMCLGKRFAQYELRAITAVVMRRLLLDADPADPLRMALTPTLGPKGGLRFLVRRR